MANIPLGLPIMDKKLCLVVCSHFLPEVNQVIKEGNYGDVVLKGFNSSCSKASLTGGMIKEILGQHSASYSKVILIGSSCISFNKEKGSLNGNVEFIQLDLCYELLLNKTTLEYLIREKCYLVSNGWLRDYKKHIRNWGFDAESAKSFFNESADKLLLLETGLKGEYLTQLEAISEHMGLKYEILPVGLSYCKLFLDSIISKWRVENERNLLNEKLASTFTRAADFALAYDQLNSLVDLIDEKEIVNKIFNFLNILFLPSNIIYSPVTGEGDGKQVFFKNEINGKSLSKDKCFSIQLSNKNEAVGVFNIIDVALPQYIEKYKEISHIIGSIGGLAIANARKFAKIREDEKQIRQYSEQLKELIATKDKFFSIIAHDLKSPFQGLLGLTELFAKDINSFSQEEMAQLSGELHGNAKNLFKLLHNLLDWARMQQGQVSYNPMELFLKEIVNENIDLLVKRGEQKEIKIASKIHTNQRVFADAAMLNSIIRNLLSNALKFSKKGGKVTVKAREVDNKMVEISVIDSGIGMSEALLNNLFKLEEKVGRKGTDGESSTGLGLLLCREFVKKHNGSIWVESKEGVGSTFYFTLPLSEISHLNEADL